MKRENLVVGQNYYYYKFDHSEGVIQITEIGSEQISFESVISGSMYKKGEKGTFPIFCALRDFEIYGQPLVNNSDLPVSAIVEKIKQSLDCNQKNIVSILGISENTLSTYTTNKWSEVKHLSCAQKLLQLLFVVEALAKDKSLTPTMIHKVIHTASPSQDQTFMDVASAIKIGTFSNQQVISIATRALHNLRRSFESNQEPSNKSLYSTLF